MLLLVTVVLSWLYGYWSNGILGTHFEISSCWTGVGAIAAAFASIVGLAKAAWTKYSQDSQFNTLNGHMPGCSESKQPNT